MKMVTLDNILSCLEAESPEVQLDENVRKAAERSIQNMVAIK
jgi:quinolinate synthase